MDAYGNGGNTSDYRYAHQRAAPASSAFAPRDGGGYAMTNEAGVMPTGARRQFMHSLAGMFNPGTENQAEEKRARGQSYAEALQQQIREKKQREDEEKYRRQQEDLKYDMQASSIGSSSSKQVPRMLGRRVADVTVHSAPMHQQMSKQAYGGDGADGYPLQQQQQQQPRGGGAFYDNHPGSGNNSYFNTAATQYNPFQQISHNRGAQVQTPLGRWIDSSCSIAITGTDRLSAWTLQLLIQVAIVSASAMVRVVALQRSCMP